MKDKLYNKALDWVKGKGFKQVRANTENYESPLAFSKTNDERQIVPDITGKKRGYKSYIEIVSKEEDKQALITKWKLLGIVASRKGGHLYLLASRGYKTFADEIVKHYNLQNTKVISI